MQKISVLILRILGWRLESEIPKDVDKCVVVMGPHTSNWDFFIGRLGFFALGVKAYFLMKKELFFFPLGFFLKYLGGIPVDRKGNTTQKITDLAVSYFNKNEKMFLVFTPEGTRSYNSKWKTGFYYVSLKANVPIYIGYMDYEKKIGGFHSKFKPSGDIDNDIEYIKSILKQYKGRYPENGIN